MFKKLMGWWKRHPGIKTTIVGGVGTAAGLAGAGVFGPKGAAIAAGASAIYGLFVKRPQDTQAEHEAETAAEGAERVGKEAEK